MFNQAASAITFTLVSIDRAVKGTINALDAWQAWSDRRCGHAQKVILGLVELAVFTACLMVWFAWLGAKWSGTVLVLCGIGELSQFVTGSPVPELGPEVEGEQIITAIERRIPAVAQIITAPVATLVVGDTDTLADLRRAACTAYNVGIDTAKDLARQYGHIGHKNTWRELIAACDL